MISHHWICAYLFCYFSFFLANNMFFAPQLDCKMRSLVYFVIVCCPICHALALFSRLQHYIHSVCTTPFLRKHRISRLLIDFWAECASARVWMASRLIEQSTPRTGESSAQNHERLSRNIQRSAVRLWSEFGLNNMYIYNLGLVRRLPLVGPSNHKHIIFAGQDDRIGHVMRFVVS